ncbi:MAG: TolC family protein [Barnesiella sp.]
MKKIFILMFILVLNRQELFTQIYLTLDQAIELAQYSRNYKALQADSLIQCYNDQLFKIKIFPKINLNATLPNLNNSISPITLADGSEKYVDRFYSSANVGLSISQLIPFTGGTLSLSSTLDRLDNFNPTHSLSYNLNLINFTYTQKITGYNQYKWEKKLHRAQKNIDNIQLIQNKEYIKGEVVELFFALYIEQRRLELNQFILDLAEYVYKRSVKLFEMRQISEEDLLEAEIEFHKAQNNNNNIAISLARQELIDYLNLRRNEELWVSFSPNCMDSYKFNFDPVKVINLAMQYTTDLYREYDIMQNEQKLKDINIEYRPSLSLSIGGGTNSQAHDFSTIMDSRLRRFNVVLSLSIPIFNWGASKLNKNIVLQEIHKSDIEYEQTKKNNHASYNYDLKNILILLSEINEEKALLELLDRRLEMIKMNVQYGKIDMSRIIQAERQLVQTHMSYINKIKAVFLLIYKYRAIALIDIRDNSTIIEFTN